MSHLLIPGLRGREGCVEVRLHLEHNMGRLAAGSCIGLLRRAQRHGPSRDQDCADGLIQQEVLLHPVDALGISGQLQSDVCHH